MHIFPENLATIEQKKFCLKKSHEPYSETLTRDTGEPVG